MRQYLYAGAKYPVSADLTRDLNRAAGRLARKIQALDAAGLEISLYTRRYFKDYQLRLAPALQMYAFILAWALGKTPGPLGEITFVDYGGGSGLFSLLAREMGLGRVIYHDIYDLSCHDAALIGGKLGLAADEYVCGDVEVLSRYLRGQAPAATVLASHDVLEHIYDLEHFFRTLGALPGAPFRVVMASGANSRNPRIARHLAQWQGRLENQGLENPPEFKPRDSHLPYVEIRRSIIAQAAPTLEPGEIDQLARATRGLKKEDISEAVARFCRQGTMPIPAHPTNTCDPLTGNWGERLLDFDELRRLARAAGFAAQIVPGYLGRDRNPLKKLVYPLRNWYIRFFPEKGLARAPNYLLVADRTQARVEKTCAPGALT